MTKDDRDGPATKPATDSGGNRGSLWRWGNRTWSSIRKNIKSAAVIAAAIGAVGAVLAALIGGVFLLIQPLATRIVDEYWNRTSEIRILDVRAARVDGKAAIDVVLWNPTSIGQAVVSVEIGLHQEGLPLLMIDKSVYRLNGILLVDRNSGAVRGNVQDEDRFTYSFDGLFEALSRGGWTLLLTVPVREKLAPGESRSILFVVPSKINVIENEKDWLTRWNPFGSNAAERWAARYLTGPKGNEFSAAELLRRAGGGEVRIRAKRGDGKTAEYLGSIKF